MKDYQLYIRHLKHGNYANYMYFRYWIKNQADEFGIAFFFKQWGTWGQDGIKRNKLANGKLLQGKIIQNMPNERK